MHRNREKRFDQSWKAAKQGVILSRRRSSMRAFASRRPMPAGAIRFPPSVCTTGASSCAGEAARSRPGGRTRRAGRIVAVSVTPLTGEAHALSRRRSTPYAAAIVFRSSVGHPDRLVVDGMQFGAHVRRRPDLRRKMPGRRRQLARVVRRHWRQRHDKHQHVARLHLDDRDKHELGVAHWRSERPGRSVGRFQRRGESGSIGPIWNDCRRQPDG